MVNGRAGLSLSGCKKRRFAATAASTPSPPVLEIQSYAFRGKGESPDWVIERADVDINDRQRLRPPPPAGAQTLVAHVEAGQVFCARCRRLILPGEPWDLGHVDGSKTKWAGPEHRKCNRQTEWHGIKRSRRLGQTSREW
jgi:hypothetical protein